MKKSLSILICICLTFLLSGWDKRENYNCLKQVNHYTVDNNPEYEANVREKFKLFTLFYSIDNQKNKLSLKEREKIIRETANKIIAPDIQFHGPVIDASNREEFINKSLAFHSSAAKSAIKSITYMSIDEVSINPIFCPITAISPPLPKGIKYAALIRATLKQETSNAVCTPRFKYDVTVDNNDQINKIILTYDGGCKGTKNPAQATN